jgi:hypothetical protein
MAKRMESISAIGDLQFVGDSIVGNMSPKIKLLERLGYIDSEPIVDEITDYRDIAEYWRKLLDPKTFYPVVYTFVVLADIPAAFIGWS